MKISCFTCKYGYEDERLGIPMCHHPKRFSEDCVDFNMHEEKDIKEPEKPMEQDGLEEELERFIASGKSVTVEDCGTYKVSYHDFKKVARHFAEWQKEQMMKEAVEGEILLTPYPTICLDDRKDYDFKDGQKVRVIIVKED